MLNKETAKHFCQSGAIDILREAVNEIVSEMPAVEFNPNSQQLAYNVGKRDGAEIALIELIESITKKANE